MAVLFLLVQAVVPVFKEMNKRRYVMWMAGEIQIKCFGSVIFPVVNFLYFPWQFCCHAAAVFNSSQIDLHLKNVKPRVWGAESPSSFARIKNPRSGFLCYRAKLALYPRTRIKGIIREILLSKKLSCKSSLSANYKKYLG